VTLFPTGYFSSMFSHGYSVSTGILYVTEEINERNNAGLLTMIQLFGMMIVLISGVGLVNTLTMNVLERTREIGMMRCIGASGGEIRTIFGSEGVFLSFFGWVLGVPAGWLVLQLI